MLYNKKDYLSFEGFAELLCFIYNWLCEIKEIKNQEIRLDVGH